MQRSPVPDDSVLTEIPFHSIRNVSCPEDIENERKVLFGHAPAQGILGLPTNENVRDYLLEAHGRKRRQPTQVHRAIMDTLVNTPHNFSVLNGGVSIVCRDYEVDEKKKTLRLLKPSIINGSQTQGVLRDYYRNMRESDATPPAIHVTFELIVTGDDGLIGEVSIARNYMDNVMPISITGRLGHLDELQQSLQKTHPNLKLRQSETELPGEVYVFTERLIQVMTALVPEELWLKRHEIGDGRPPNKTYTYQAKARCQRLPSCVQKSSR